MPIIISLDPQQPSVESGDELSLTVKFKTERAGLSVNVRAKPRDHYVVEPSEHPLPESHDGGEETIKVVVKRLQKGLPACIIEGTLGSGSPAYAMVSVK